MNKLGSTTPSDVPQRRWVSIGTDFIVSIENTASVFNIISTCVDRISRRVQYIPFRGENSAVGVSNFFFSKILKLHLLPDSIISYRDLKFISMVCTNLFSLCRISRKIYSTPHRKTYGHLKSLTGWCKLPTFLLLLSARLLGWKSPILGVCVQFCEEWWA